MRCIRNRIMQRTRVKPSIRLMNTGYLHFSLSCRLRKWASQYKTDPQSRNSTSHHQATRHPLESIATDSRRYVALELGSGNGTSQLPTGNRKEKKRVKSIIVGSRQYLALLAGAGKAKTVVSTISQPCLIKSICWHASVPKLVTYAIHYSPRIII